MSFVDGTYMLQESQTLEFKEAASGLPEDIWETYSAFANTEGGEIVLGVHEDTASQTFKLVGVPDPKSLIEDFWKEIRNQKKVSRDILLSDSVTALHRDDLDFVVIAVPRASREEKPVETYDKRRKQMVAWVRKGSGDFAADSQELRLM